MLNAYITNLEAYVNGELRGEWLHLPASKEDIKAAFERSGIGPDDEYFLSDYECDNFLYDCLGEYENIYDLNVIAALAEKKSFHPEAIEGFLRNNGDLSLQEIGNLLMQADELPYTEYMFEGIENCTDMSPEEKYGYTYLEQSGKYSELEKLGMENYIDYEAIGRDAKFSGLTLLENGYYDESADQPDLQRYTMQELYEEAGIEVDARNQEYTYQNKEEESRLSAEEQKDLTVSRTPSYKQQEPNYRPVL